MIADNPTFRTRSLTTNRLNSPMATILSHCTQWIRRDKRKRKVNTQHKTSHGNLVVQEHSSVSNCGQRATLYRTTSGKLRQQWLPLWVMLHLKHLLCRLENHGTPIPPTLPCPSYNYPPSKKRPWNKGWMPRKPYATTAVMYIVDCDSAIHMEYLRHAKARQTEEDQDHDDDVPLGDLFSITQYTANSSK
ncbi:uncharacterized protein BYT42DRAFT_541636 [Radiomyces spectabilis]|uniref:uncharacterized protein n=1 Tax=Radiomyces spectabilis TaxID=64574 RepID=UPI0022203560|nr:uncharacterized protein BYT42DRAFT_541636 [Radiomyces spectabilis]KAI8393345.1 hypothetical protein BYT42DRAFT_541636 [Radiomyces spectabilis]